MSFTCWNAPNVKYNTLEKQKLNSKLVLITTKKMYGNQKLHLQAAIFPAETMTSNTHAKFILIEQIRHVDIDPEKNKERLKQRENFWILTPETLTPKGLNQEFN